jgi:hypothetical protein
MYVMYVRTYIAYVCNVYMYECLECSLIESSKSLEIITERNILLAVLETKGYESRPVCLREGPYS